MTNTLTHGSVVYGMAVDHNRTAHVGQTINGEYFRHRGVAFWTDQINDDPITLATHLLARCGVCGEWVDLDQFEIAFVAGGSEYVLASTDAHNVSTSADSIRALIDWIVREHLDTAGYRTLLPDIDRSPIEVKVLHNDDTIPPPAHAADAVRPQYIQTGETSLAIQTIAEVIVSMALAGGESLPKTNAKKWIDDWDLALREIAWWLERYQVIVDDHVAESMITEELYNDLKAQQTTLIEFINPDRLALADVRRIADEQIHLNHLKIIALTAKADEVDES